MERTMTGKRKRYSSEFKAKVSIEALKEQKTLSELANQYDLHPIQIAKWKKRLIDGSPEIFANSSKNHRKNQQALEARLYQQIGQLTVELDWLKKKL
jgi:transposase-like protein